MALFEKVVMDEWEWLDEIELIALEELNALIAWSERQAWDKPPKMPDLDKRLKKNLDVDARIVMSWDADATDMALHVLEPSGEEAFYSHNRTAIGGLVSHHYPRLRDRGIHGPPRAARRIPDLGALLRLEPAAGRGPAGPVTVTATVLTDFGRATEKKQVLTLRLDKPDQTVEIGRIAIGGGKAQARQEPGAAGAGDKPASRATFRAIAVGIDRTGQAPGRRARRKEARQGR